MAGSINFGGGIPQQQIAGFNNFQANNFNSGFGASPFSGSPVNPFNAVQLIQQLISAMSQLSGQWGGIVGGNTGGAGNVGGAGNTGGAGSAYGGGGQAGGVGGGYGGGQTGGAYGGGQTGGAYGGGQAPRANVAIAVNATPPPAKGGGAGAYG